MSNVHNIPWKAYRVTRRLDGTELLHIVQKQDELGWYDVATCTSFEDAVRYSNHLERDSK